MKAAAKRELEREWEELKKKHSAPLSNKNWGGKRRPAPKKLNPVEERLALNRDRLPVGPSKIFSEPVQRSQVKLTINGMDEDEYRAREAAAREVKHCVMPLHKSNYVVVTDAELLSQMGKKTA